MSDPQVASKLEMLLQRRGHEIFCFVSSNYWATRIRGAEKMLHDVTGIPLVIQLHDHPLYFLGEQNPLLDGTLTLSLGTDSADFILKHYPVRTEVITRYGAPPGYDAGPPRFEQFLARRNFMLCPINLAYVGTTLDGFWAQIKALPARRRIAATRLAEAALTECLVPLHVVAERFPPFDDPAEAASALSDQLLVLNFLKFWRRNKLVRAIIDLPVLISSEYIPADLEFSHPDKFTLLSRKETLPMYREFRFTLNANPMLTDVLHERVLEPLFANSVCVSDRNATLNRYFADERSILFFDYDRDDSVAKIAQYFDDPAAAYDLTLNAYETRIGTDNLHLLDAYRDLIAAVQQRWEESGARASA